MEPFIQKDEKNAKYIILDDLRKTVKLIRHLTAEGTVLGNESSAAQSLSHCLDLSLRHGLIDAHKGYWPLVQHLTHSATRQIIDSLTQVHSPLGKGRAWLHLTLTEGSLDSYFKCLSRDKRTLHKHYATYALMRDLTTLQQLVAVVAGLQHVQFNLDADVGYLDMSTYKHPTLFESQSTSQMTSSLTSSLASPVDSGVALLDSDIDATSISEATFSLRDDDSVSTETDYKMDQDIDISEPLSSHTQPAYEAKEEVQHMFTPNTEDAFATTSINSKLFRKPILLEAVLLKTQDDKNSYLSTVKNSTDMEDPLVHDSSSQFAMTAKFPNQETELQDEKSSRKLSDMSSLGINRVYTMTASDIANQNISPLPSDVVTHMANISIEKNIAGELNNSSNTDDQVSAQQTDCDEIVYRRHRNKKPKSEVKVKRVSFHEDLIVTTTHDIATKKQVDPSLVSRRESDSCFSTSVLPPSAILKKDVMKERYSWCGGGDAPNVSQRSVSNTRSDVYLASANNFEPSERNNLSKQTVSNSQQLGLKNSSQETKKSDKSIKTLRDRNSYSGEMLHRYRDMGSMSQLDSVNGKMLQMDSLLPLTGDSKRYSHGFLAERGAPEGQEDPQRTSSTLQLYASPLSFPSAASSIDCFSDVESVLSDLESRCKTSRISSLHGSLNKLSAMDSKLGVRRNSVFDAKRSLLNRFLKLVTMKKLIGKRAKVVKVSRSMYIKGVKRNDSLNNEYNSELNCVIEEGMRSLPIHCGYNASVSADMHLLFKNRVFFNSNEVLFKAYRVRSCYFTSGESTPLLLLLTDAHLYVTGVKDNYVFCNHLVLPFANLDSLLVGPNSQTVLLVSKDRITEFLLATGDADATQQMLGDIELAVRRSVHHRPLNVKCLSLDEMINMKRSLVQQGAVLKEEELCHYSLVHLQDNQASPPPTPLGPTKEGHLMFRQASEAAVQPWAPGFFILKAGVVYIFEDQGHRLPKHVVMLRNGHCKGCRRLVDRRPYTFEVSLSRVRSIQFAASDEYQASDWLQAFIQSAAGVYELSSLDTTACSLVLTTNHIVTCRERFPSGRVKALAVAHISDLSAFHAEESWCVLEFACREVHETSGDWIVYFASVNEMQAFQASLKRVWPTVKEVEFPLSGKVEPDLVTRCMETGQLLGQAWDQLLPAN